MGEDPTATEHGPNTRRVTVAEAAEILGITAEAVRTRIKRDKLTAVKDAGTVYVLLQADQTGPNIDPTPQGQDQTPDQTERIDELRDRVAFLERELERRGDEAERLQRIIAGLAQANAEQARTIRAIEAPASEEATEDAETVEEAPEVSVPRSATGGSQEGTHKPWWRRVFRG